MHLRLIFFNCFYNQLIYYLKTSMNLQFSAILQLRYMSVKTLIFQVGERRKNSVFLKFKIAIIQYSINLEKSFRMFLRYHSGGKGIFCLKIIFAISKNILSENCFHIPFHMFRFFCGNFKVLRLFGSKYTKKYIDSKHFSGFNDAFCYKILLFTTCKRRI